jgi:hypothetical protein
MCDYSLHAVATRPAEVADTLISAKFQSTTTRGFASPDNLHVAVCLRPGTEIASRRTFKLTVCCFARTSAIDWRDFAK